MEGVWGRPILYEHDCVHVCKGSSIKTKLGKSGVEELEHSSQSHDLNLTEHLWDEVEHKLQARSSYQTSEPDLTNALLPEWVQIPTDAHNNLMGTHRKRVENIMFHWRRSCSINAHDFEIGYPTSSYRCNGQVSTNL